MEYIRGLKKDIILSRYTTYKIGGVADYFFIAKNQTDLQTVLEFARREFLPIFILAGGSNVLFSDEGFRGLVVKIDNQEIKILDDYITVGAGVLMQDIVNKSISSGLSGLEWAGGLPGTLGGAIRGNAGCFGGEIKDIIENVQTLNSNGELKYYSNKDCCFLYRDSVFKKNGEVILSAILKLNPGDSEKLKAEVFDHIKYRQERHPLEYPNCGSVFKNCSLDIVSKSVQERFKEKIKTDPFPILPTAVLISACGFKGLSIGGAKISEKHPNFIVNFNNAKAGDIIELIGVVKDKVKQELGVILSEEIEFAGF